jgi:hypothetical protein
VQSASGDINIVAEIDNGSKADSRGISGGLLGVGVSIADANIGGAVNTHMSGSVSDARNLSVKSLVDNDADADAQAVSAGGVSGSGADAGVGVAPSVRTHIGGRSGVPGDVVTSEMISVGGAVDVQTQMFANADALAKGKSVGGLSVNVSRSDVTVSPAIDTYIGDGQTVTADTGVIVGSLYNHVNVKPHLRRIRRRREPSRQRERSSEEMVLSRTPLRRPMSTL